MICHIDNQYFFALELAERNRLAIGGPQLEVEKGMNQRVMSKVLT